MDGFRVVVGFFALILTAILMTSVGINQYQSGGTGVWNGTRILIFAAFLWGLLIVGGIVVLRKRLTAANPRPKPPAPPNES